jgi:hypothetical protein
VIAPGTRYQPEAKAKVLKTTLMLPKVQNAFLKKTSYF